MGLEPFYYDNGRLRHSYNKAMNKVKAGEFADTNISDKGYRTVQYAGKSLKAHRVIWEMFNGEIPNGYVIDHVNNDRSDNRIENLRLATNAENCRNRKGANCTSKTKARGVQKLPSGKYRVRVYANGKDMHIGVFDSLEEAIEKSHSVRVEVYKEFA